VLLEHRKVNEQITPTDFRRLQSIAEKQESTGKGSQII